MLIEEVTHRCGVLGQLSVVAFDIGDQVLGQRLPDSVGATDRAQTTQNGCGLGGGQVRGDPARQQLAQQRVQLVDRLSSVLGQSFPSLIE
ncbi:hypothetical protein OH799_04950 [Nocardia sp. NBC_00881]|uniref:hypothetical protein n=1 Tax=Nocardia sp. NBC_00881 TaxID=2975995 RepID=UPI00386D6599|nr:hypothetical protein OH799_04950 [Nocardia sp. NBC_00881]